MTDLIPDSGLKFTDHACRQLVAPSRRPCLDPAIQFGEPSIHHTRIPTSAAWVPADDEARRRRPKLLVARRQWRRPGEIRQPSIPASSHSGRV